VDKKQTQFPWEECMAFEVVQKSLDTTAIPLFLIHKPKLRALLLVEIARGFPTNQPGAIVLVDIIDVDLDRRARRDAERIRVCGHIRHRDIDQPTPQAEDYGDKFPDRELILQAMHMRY
jgi:hypothetical protein